jgi:hypothetical protein
MAIINPILRFAQSQPAVAPQRRVNLVQPEFYSQQPELPQQAPSGDYIAQQLQKIKERSAPPKLEPGSRVKSINSDVANSSNFQGFYDRLRSIDQIGKEQLAAAQAQAALARLRASQAINSAVGGGSAAAPTSRVASSSGSNFGRAGSAIGTTGVPTNPRENFKYAQNIAGNFGWGNPSELSAWYTLGMKESGWRNTAQNPTSTAYGIGQFLNSTWKGYGIPKTSDPALQVEAMARYIKARYGSPSRALAFHYRNNWY